MIRRDLPADGQSPNRWVLIDQIEHAHLAARLAEQWGAAPYAPLVSRQELLWAIEHHDDGWRQRDEQPDVDPSTGVPRAFTEMEIHESLAIWTGSIEGARIVGPLPGYVVAGHFCALARRAAAWKKADPAWSAAEQFITGYEAKMQDWLAAWQAQSPAKNTTTVAQRALQHLQFFDSLSLWFCCAGATEPDTVSAPGATELTLSPLAAERVGLAPWPFLVPSLNLEVPGRLVLAGRYPTRQALAAVPMQPVLLRWQLQPDA